MAGRILSEDSFLGTAESKAIDRLGSDPAQWITALHDLEKVQNESRKRKLLGCFFSRVHRQLNPKEYAKNKYYAVLLSKEATFHGTVNMDHARSKFESAILTCQLPIVHIMYAQFELNSGNHSKAMRILSQAKFEYGATTEIQTAIEKLIDGRSDICSDTVDCGQNFMLSTKHLSSEHSANAANYSKERNTRDISQSTLHNLSLHNLSISTPKLNKDGTARLLRRQKDLVSVIDKCDKLQPAQAQSPVTNASLIDVDIGLQSPAAPDLSMLSREFQPTNTQQLLEKAKRECHQKSHESPILKLAENKKSEFIHDKPVLISKKIALPNLSSHKKFLQGPQRVLRVSKCESDDEDDDQKNRQKTLNVDSENTKPPSVKANEPKVTESSPKRQATSEHVASTLLSVPSLNINQSSISAFKPPMKIQAKTVVDTKVDEDKENKVPQFVNTKPSNPIEKKIQDIPSYRVDYPPGVEKPRHVYDRKVHVQGSSACNADFQSVGEKPRHGCDRKVALTLRQTDLAEKMRAPLTAAELVKDKKVLHVNGVSYLVLKILGKGGSSKVYEAYDPKNSLRVAIKQVDLTDGDEQVLDGYKNEINFLTSLQGSRHIVKLIDYELNERYLHLVMECGSLDLSVFLKTEKASGASFDIIDLKMLWKNMLCAVRAIHGHGIIHLDLKPANFMFVGGNLKLIDFGIANSIQADATSVIKDTQFGTLNYMAPEMIIDMSGGVQIGSSCQPKFKVGPKADVWSLGCILYYIMYGKTPFQHIHHQAMKLFAITNENHKVEFPNFPFHEFVEIVQICLVRDPKKRPSVEMLLKHPVLMR